jgi:hypothetical protein
MSDSTMVQMQVQKQAKTGEGRLKTATGWKEVKT